MKNYFVLKKIGILVIACTVCNFLSALKVDAIIDNSTTSEEQASNPTNSLRLEYVEQLKALNKAFKKAQKDVDDNFLKMLDNAIVYYTKRGDLKTAQTVQNLSVSMKSSSNLEEGIEEGLPNVLTNQIRNYRKKQAENQNIYQSEKKKIVAEFSYKISTELSNANKSGDLKTALLWQNFLSELLSNPSAEEMGDKKNSIPLSENSYLSDLTSVEYEVQVKSCVEVEELKRGKSKPVKSFGITPGKTSPFACVFEGMLNIEKTLVYTFYLSADDGATLYIDGKAIIMIDKLLRVTPFLVKKTLRRSQGRHRFKVVYFNSEGASNLDLNVKEIKSSGLYKSKPVQAKNPKVSDVKYKVNGSSWTTYIHFTNKGTFWREGPGGPLGGNYYFDGEILTLVWEVKDWAACTYVLKDGALNVTQPSYHMKSFVPADGLTFENLGIPFREYSPNL